MTRNDFCPKLVRVIRIIRIYGADERPQMGQKIWLTLIEIKKKTVYFIWLQLISSDAQRCPNPTHKQKFFFPQLVMEILTFPYGVGK